MHIELIERLACPQCGLKLALHEPQHHGDRIRSGSLACERDHRYPVVEFVPRFVPQSNYANNFGLQWNKFRQTQLDSFSGHPISAKRFWHATGWTPASLEGQWLLDVGCGAGRFAEIALQAGAHVVALDYSSAVDACYANLHERFARLHVVQGDVYALPFIPRSFAFVYSLGVLQHTPDVPRAFAALPPMVQPGGRLSVDFYEKSWKASLLPKYWLRPFTKRMPQDRLLTGLQRAVPKLLKISRALGRTPVLGPNLKRLVPVADYEGALPLTEEQRQQWALLDTFDWLAPEYDNPQNAKAVRAWLQRSGMEQIEVLKAGHLVGRGVAPNVVGG